MSTGSWACDPPSNGFLEREASKEVKIGNLDEIIPGVIQSLGSGKLRNENEVCTAHATISIQRKNSVKVKIGRIASARVDCRPRHSPAKPGNHVTALFEKPSPIGRIFRLAGCLTNEKLRL